MGQEVHFIFLYRIDNYTEKNLKLIQENINH